MTRKVRLALVAHDLRAEIKTYSLNEDGSAIVVDKEIPATNIKIEPDGFIEIPFKIGPLKFYRKLYVAVAGSTVCMNFKTGTIGSVDIETVKKVARAEILKNWGRDVEKTPWWAYLLVILGIIGALGALGAF